MWFNYGHWNFRDFTMHQHSSFCKSISEIQKSSSDYYLIILTETLTEILTEAASW